MLASEMGVIGIDPGSTSGGIALVGSGESDSRPVKNMTAPDIFLTVKEFASRASVGFIEKVHSMPKQGLSSTFKFGASYGELRMALIATGIRWVEVSPRKWQKYFGLILPDLTKTDKKNRHKEMAQSLFPGIKMTHAKADALLIAEYGRVHR